MRPSGRAGIQTMQKVNFFILGAPKCGTTAMVDYLGQHPEIFIPYIKEPNYFCDDFPHIRKYADLDEYLAIFPFAESQYQVFGDATVWNLYSQTAVQNIVSYNPDAKFLAMIRKPQEMLPSLHSQLIFSNWEEIASFEEAWSARADRKLGRRLPKNALDPALVYYDEVCKYAPQIERIYAHARPENVMVVFFEDFKQDPARVTRDVMKFLGVNPEVELKIEVINSNKKQRFPRLVSFLMYPPFPFSVLKTLLKNVHFIKKAAPMRRFYKSKMMTSYTDREKISAKVEREIIDEHREDVRRLSELTGRDLGAWSVPKEKAAG